MYTSTENRSCMQGCELIIILSKLYYKWIFPDNLFTRDSFLDNLIRGLQRSVLHLVLISWARTWPWSSVARAASVDQNDRWHHISLFLQLSTVWYHRAGCKQIATDSRESKWGSGHRRSRQNDNSMHPWVAWVRPARGLVPLYFSTAFLRCTHMKLYNLTCGDVVRSKLIL